MGDAWEEIKKQARARALKRRPAPATTSTDCEWCGLPISGGPVAMARHVNRGCEVAARVGLRSTCETCDAPLPHSVGSAPEPSK